jgi:hypothetical protein
MYTSIRSFSRQTVIPRWLTIVKSPDCLIALAVGVLCFYGFSCNEVLRDEIISNLISYTSISLGFSVSSFALILSISSSDLLDSLKSTIGRANQTAYSNLIFIFIWNALCHWVAIVSLIIVRSFPVLVGFSKANQQLLVQVSYFYFASLITYCFLRFLITIITLSQFGDLAGTLFDETNDSYKLPRL